MAEQESVKQRIVASVFADSEDTYVGHVKVIEDGGLDGGGRKVRFIILSQTRSGSGVIHKAKANTNGSFSVGKTWRLQELRGIEIHNNTSFTMTLARSYRWDTESSQDQSQFCTSVVRLFRALFDSSTPLRLVGVSEHQELPPVRTSNVSRSSRAEGSPTRASSSRRALPDEERPSSRSMGASQSRSHLKAISDDFQTNITGRVSRPTSPNNNGSTSKSRIAHSSTRPESPAPLDNHGYLNGSNRSPSRTGHSSSFVVGQGTSNHQSSSQRIPSRSGRQSPASSAPSHDTGMPASLGSTRSHLRRTSDAVWSADYIPPPAALATDRMSASTEASVGKDKVIEKPPLSHWHKKMRPSSTGQNSSAAVFSQSLPRPTASRAIPSAADEQVEIINRRDITAKARISFFDPANQAALDRLIAGAGEAVTVGGQARTSVEGGDEEESAQAMLNNVEEMLESFEWATDDLMGRKSGAKGTADLIEARLLSELTALDKANIHSFLESDDRIGMVVKFLDDSIEEIDRMDSLVQSYKIHLNTVTDDISFIQSQNRGLQIQTQNQKILLREIQNLLQIVQVDKDALAILNHESLENSASIQRLEDAATELYKALQAGQDTEMAATMERLDEYRTHNAQFCKRIFDFLSIMVLAQSNSILGDTNGLSAPSKGRRHTIKSHQSMEEYLGRYAGLIMYLKEMDESVYAKLCASYFGSASDLHSKQIKAFMTSHLTLIKRADDEKDQNFGVTPTSSGIKRAGTLIRSPMEGRRDKDRDKTGEMRASEAFALILENISPQIYREDDFLADFLQINDAGFTFADYANLDNYFRRHAARNIGLGSATLKLVRNAMDLIFGFLANEFKVWVDAALAKDGIQVIGMLAVVERFVISADESGNAFLTGALEKQRNRLRTLFDRHINDQVKSVEQTKLTSKKRKGAAAFIKYFPTYIGRVEEQLIGADDLEIRSSVDNAYDQIVQSMFDGLKQMAKLEGEGEDKGQLNYHIILIENMHYFIAEIGQLQIGCVSGFLRRAEVLSEENMSAYVSLVLRRPFAKIIDYFDGVERLLTTTAPTEVANNPTYSRSALKKVVKDYTAKDVRKYVDTLYKRVEKHFQGDDGGKTPTGAEEAGHGIIVGSVLSVAWKACEDELLKITEMFGRRIVQCYAQSGVTLDYNLQDIEAAFRRHRKGS